MSTIANPIASALPSTSTSTAAPAIANGLGNEETFLKLLVSQLQNQNPLSPTDSNQFVAQLTSYSQLEQLIGIHKDTTTLATPAPAQASSPGNVNTTTAITGAS